MTTTTTTTTASPATDGRKKASIYSAMSRVLADIHRLDFRVDELKDFGKTDGAYLKRNLARWAGQVRESSEAGLGLG